eukprot:6176686-Pleurochrysis_carterae.AAC.3
MLSAAAATAEQSTLQLSALNFRCTTDSCKSKQSTRPLSVFHGLPFAFVAKSQLYFSAKLRKAKHACATVFCRALPFASRSLPYSETVGLSVYSSKCAGIKKRDEKSEGDLQTSSWHCERCKR